jgi:hypothetical protein
MKFENTNVYNFEGAFHGMRAPLESWEQSDSFFGIVHDECDFPESDISDFWIDKENVERRAVGLTELSPEMEDYNKYYDRCDKIENWLRENGVLSEDGYYASVAYLGPRDLDLAQRLIAAGPEHAKFLRQIFVCVDITAPLYWWKECDTYKIGTVANSTSTMHKLASTPITLDCFEMDDYNSELIIFDEEPWSLDVYTHHVWEDIINICETLRQRYLETKDKRYWKELIRLLPESWLQTRTVTMSYANIRNIYTQRQNHKLSEWHQFCDWAKVLPYSNELITSSIV